MKQTEIGTQVSDFEFVVVIHYTSCTSKNTKPSIPKLSSPSYRSGSTLHNFGDIEPEFQPEVTVIPKNPVLFTKNNLSCLALCTCSSRHNIYQIKKILIFHDINSGFLFIIETKFHIDPWHWNCYQFLNLIYKISSLNLWLFNRKIR